MYTQQEKQDSSNRRLPTGWLPDPTLFNVGVVIFACIGLAVVLTVLEPPRLIDHFDVFATPQVLPEWYLLPAFAIIKSLPSKLIGLVLLGGLVGSLFLVPFLPDLSKRLPGGRLLVQVSFIGIHVAVAILGFLTVAG